MLLSILSFALICSLLQFFESCVHTFQSRMVAFIFCLDYFLLHVPEQLLMWQEGTDISMDLDNLWLWKLFKMFLNYFLFLYCFLYNPFLYTWEKVLEPLCFTLNMRNLPMNSVFILREKRFLLQLLLKSQMQVYDHGKDLCLALCVCVFNVLTAENQIAFNFHFLNPT